MKKIVLFLAVLFTAFSASLTAQVAIGTDQNPHGGAVLDLSQASGQNGLGLLLPRVFLNDVKVWQIDGVSTDGTGMVVYNTNPDVVDGNGAGIYVWDGLVWSPVKSSVNTGLPGDYGTPDGTTSNPSLSGITCFDVRDGQGEPGTQQYVLTEGGSKVIQNVVWVVAPSAAGLLESNAANNLTQTLVFASRTTLSAAAATAQTVTVTAYITYTDATKVQVSETIKIQNKACCPGYLLSGGVFTSPDKVASGISQTTTLNLGSSTGEDLCIGPNFTGSNTWNTVSGTDWCNTNVHNQGNEWNDGDDTWRLPNIVELANMHNYKVFIPNLAATNYWSSTTHTTYNINAVTWNFGSQNTGFSNKTVEYTMHIRCVKAIN